MFKSALDLNRPDPYFSGTAGFVANTLEDLHEDMRRFELPEVVPDKVRHAHDAIRHAYIYAYFSYDLLSLAASQTFPCLELALRERIGHQFAGRVNKRGKPHPAMLNELLKVAKKQNLIVTPIDHLHKIRNMFAHGSDTVLNPPMFLTQFGIVTNIIRELYSSR
ncbi:hypothetical protein [Methylovirgula sp. 4M-Z18]|uniref:hypothetical protein n=1 Tax=Methylovirgula sp. 4M-Z18 TaxID=2293567 RepID=UPI000E2E6A3A|nr:hypothetical protein [Methylovirgula sp. 4M-Z18]RFB81163.1 hypothetical protein DYH55_06875 [Methylovirgula sp. 4M-Z18]